MGQGGDAMVGTGGTLLGRRKGYGGGGGGRGLYGGIKGGNG